MRKEERKYLNIFIILKHRGDATVDADLQGIFKGVDIVIR